MECLKQHMQDTLASVDATVKAAADHAASMQQVIEQGEAVARQLQASEVRHAAKHASDGSESEDCFCDSQQPGDVHELAQLKKRVAQVEQLLRDTNTDAEYDPEMQCDLRPADVMQQLSQCFVVDLPFGGEDERCAARCDCG